MCRTNKSVPVVDYDTICRTSGRLILLSEMHQGCSMQSPTRVVVTAAAVVILSRNSLLMTSIPLRMWTTRNGTS